MLDEHRAWLMSVPGVVGTAIGLCDGIRCIHVFLARESAEARERIPSRLDGYEVRAEVTGIIRAR